MRPRLDRIRSQLEDDRGGRVVFLSHCLLNQNVRYLGGARHEAGVRDLVDGYLKDGVGICQLPCPEQRAWGGVLKRRMLMAYGAGDTWRSPLVRHALGIFLAYTRLVYWRLAREVAAEIADYRDSGLEVVGVVGIAGSPSCGVRTTLNVPAAVDVLCTCPLSELDRHTVEERAVGANTRTGQGLFTATLRRQLKRRGAAVPFLEHDLTGEPRLPRSPQDSDSSRSE